MASLSSSLRCCISAVWQRTEQHGCYFQLFVTLARPLEATQGPRGRRESPKKTRILSLLFCSSSCSKSFRSTRPGDCPPSSSPSPSRHVTLGRRSGGETGSCWSALLLEHISAYFHSTAACFDLVLLGPSLLQVMLRCANRGVFPLPDRLLVVAERGRDRKACGDSCQAAAEQKEQLPR